MACPVDEPVDEPCALCGRGGGAAELCGGCGALSLCARCAPHHPPADCARLRAWMADAGEGGPPTTSCTILTAAGLHGRGVWIRACAPPGDAGSAPWGSLAPPLPAPGAPAAPPDLARFLGLADDAVPDLKRIEPDAVRHATGPAGLLLHRPATAARAAGRVLAAAHRTRAPSSPTFTLALLGVRAEVDAWPVLLYVHCLLPSAAGCGPSFDELHLACVSPDVPVPLDGATAVFGGPAGGLATTTRLSFTRGLWHDVAGRLGTPDAVAALDAGLAAAPEEWLPTLAALLEANGTDARPPPPILVTDLHAEAAHAAAALARQGLSAATVSGPLPNPHRRPLPSARAPGSLRLPAHECGWAFWIESAHHLKV